MQEFARRLRQERELRLWSQEQVAEKIGTTAPSVSRWERGTTFPGLHFRQKLCTLFGKTAEELGLTSEGTDERSKELLSQALEDQRISPPPFVATQTIWNVVYRRNPFFTGREEVLTHLHNMLHSEKVGAPTQAQALCGLGGIGKTQTAIEYAYRFHGEYQTVLWAQAETYDVLWADFVKLAAVLHLSVRHAQDQGQAVEAVKHWLNDNTGWLLILDNVEDLGLIEEFTPAGGKGHILLTTRIQSTRTFAHRIELEQMEPDDGALFLLRRALRIERDASLEQASVADRTVAREISQLMGGLPLALDQAGAYVEETACSLSNYLERYQRRRAALLNLRDLRGGSRTDHPQSVSATFTLSFELLERAHPAAADLLRLCAFLHPDAIPEEILTEGAPALGPILQHVAADPFLFDAAIAALRTYSLLRRNPNTKTLTLHRLVQAVLKDSMDAETQHLWAERAVQAINRAFPDGKPDLICLH